MSWLICLWRGHKWMVWRDRVGTFNYNINGYTWRDGIVLGRRCSRCDKKDTTMGEHIGEM